MKIVSKQIKRWKYGVYRFTALILVIGMLLSISPISFFDVNADDGITVEAPVDEKTDELEYQTISRKMGKNNITLDGLMPVNAEVSIQNSPEYKKQSLFAYDISITDQSGTEFQPVSNEPIKVEITNPVIKRSSRNSKQLRLWHIDADGIREQITDFTIQEDTICFEASGFSVYELDDGSSALRTYRFYLPNDPNQNTDYHEYYFPTSSQNTDGTYKEICEQIIKGTEKPIFPKLPADVSSRHTFVGWYTNPNAEGEPFDFDGIPPVTETETIYLYAVFQSCHFAIFYDQYNSKTNSYPVFATRRRPVENGIAYVPYHDLMVVYDDDSQKEGQPPQMAFKGWSTTPIQDYTSVQNPEVIQTEYLELTATTRFYPVFEPIRWLQFFTGETGSGATYIPPKSFPSEQGFSFHDEGASSKPIRAGYVFDGWFTAPDGGTRITDEDQNLVSNLNTTELEVRNGRLYLKPTVTVDGIETKLIQSTLYAHWKKGQSKYTVIIWKQKPTDDVNLANTDKTYDFQESHSIAVQTESTVSVDSSYKQKNYPGFSYSRCSASTRVTGDGKTILDVYYDRNVYTLTFKVGNRTVKTITALYGSYIKDHFPITGYKDYIWRDQANTPYYQYVLATIETMPDQNVTFAGTSRAARHTAYYYAEIDEEDASDYAETKVFDEQLFGLYKTVEHGFYVLTYNEEYHPIEGYTTDRSWAIPYFGERGTRTSNNQIVQDPNTAPIGGYTLDRTTDPNVNYLFYKRAQYDIQFYDSSNDELIRTVPMKYRQRIASHLPPDPTPPPGYHFSGWFADQSCSTKVFFTEPTQAEIDSTKDKNGVTHYQVYDRMPATNLLIFAGWETDWFRIEIDPDGGELDSNQSTFFWEPFNGDPIEEYRNVSRNYEPDVNGEYYYYKHDRAYYHLGNEWSPIEDTISDRGARYTTNADLATSEQRYREAPGAYRYLGWYEVKENGEEVPYNFGTRVTKDTHLRLHWKQLVTYYITYNAGAGTIDTGDENEKTFTFLDADDYNDHAEVVVTRVANAPKGLNFIGWKIRNDPSEKVYYPGASFGFRSDYAQAISELQPDGTIKTDRIITMDAIYREIKNSCIVYDANGGTVNGTLAADPDHAGGATMFHFNAGDEGTTYSATETQLTVGDLVNNTAVRLSDGTGFSNHNYTFLGWNTKPDGSGNAYSPSSMKTYYADTNEPIILYAQWEIRVYFDKNNANSPNTPVGWGGDWHEYHYDPDTNRYYTAIHLNAPVSRPTYHPVSDNTEEMFHYWSMDRQTSVGVMRQNYDFSTPVTQELLGSNTELVLYGCWYAPIKIPVYIVDTSTENWVRRDGWLKNGTDTRIVLNNGTPVFFTARAEANVYADEEAVASLKWEFACTQGNGAEDYKNISEDTEIRKIWYDADAMCVKVQYSDESEHDFDPATEAVYLVYYTRHPTIPIRYKLMHLDDSLTAVDMKSTVPHEAVIPAPGYGDYVMGNNITQPIDDLNTTPWLDENETVYYSFAVGRGSTAAESAANLGVITRFSDSDVNRPVLHVQNTWNGYHYSLEGDHWHDTGYDLGLYVIYYDSPPTIVTLTEKTIALPEDMSKNFSYHIEIKQTESQTVQTKFYYYNRGQYTPLNSGDYQTQTENSSQTTVVHRADITLNNDQEHAGTMFYQKFPDQSTDYRPYLVNGVQQKYNTYFNSYNVYYTETITNHRIYDTIEITQTAETGFSTTNDAEAGDGTLQSVFTSTDSSDFVTITYTNTRQLQQEIHVAVKTGEMILAKDTLRTENASIYRHLFNGASDWSLDPGVSASGLITEPDQFIFLGVITGNRDSYDHITDRRDNVMSVSFGELSEDEYGYYLNGETTQQLDTQEIWFVYCPRPTVRYMFERPNGELVPIEPLTKNGTAFQRNGVPIAQGEMLPLERDKDLHMSVMSTYGSSAYLIPNDLDYSGNHNMLDLKHIDIGTSSGEVICSNSKTLYLDVREKDLTYRFQETDEPQSLGENNVIYVVYKVRGYELTLTKTVKGDTGGVNDFSFTITSSMLTHSFYYIRGYDSDETIPVTLNRGEGKLELTLHKGDSVTIYGLQIGNYFIHEDAAGSYEMSASINDVDTHVSDGTFVVSLGSNTDVEVLNLYPIPVTNTGEGAVPYLLIIAIISIPAILFFCKRKGVIWNEPSSV